MSRAATDQHAALRRASKHRRNVNVHEHEMHCRRRCLRQPFLRRRACGAKDFSARRRRADRLGAARRDRAEERRACRRARAKRRSACRRCAACERRSGQDACGEGKRLPRAGRGQRASRQRPQTLQGRLSEGMIGPPVASRGRRR